MTDMSINTGQRTPSSHPDNERTPLLPSDSTVKHDSSQVIVTVTEPADTEAAISDISVAKDVDQSHSSSKWRLFKIVFLTILVVCIAAVFVKGFIDADDVDLDLGKALKSALGGGVSGAAAMVLQVLTLMPLRTVMNYQYRYGTTTTQAIKTLYHDGGWTRYYQGLTAALIQGPVSRFGDTAANAGILALLHSNAYMKKFPSLVQTIFASLAAALFRMILTPVDTVKTTLQTQGRKGMRILRERVKVNGVGSLWYGAVATAAATFVGHYPWFGTYNFLDENLPCPHTLLEKLGRQAFIGFCASIISDTVSNSLRVVKTYRQVNETRISYFAAARAVVEVDGWKGLFGRGLKTRILANGLQGLMFSILWKVFLDLWNGETSKVGYCDD